MATMSLRPCGDYRATYRNDTTIFPTPMSRNFCIAGVVLLCVAPLFLSHYHLNARMIFQSNFPELVVSTFFT